MGNRLLSKFNTTVSRMTCHTVNVTKIPHKRFFQLDVFDRHGLRDCKLQNATFEFFVFNTELPIMAKLASKDFTVAKNKLDLLPVGLDVMITGSRV